MLASIELDPSLRKKMELSFSRALFGSTILVYEGEARPSLGNLSFSETSYPAYV